MRAEACWGELGREEEEEKRLRWLFSDEGREGKGREGEDGCGATATELAARFQSRGALAVAVAELGWWGWRPFQRRAAQPPQPRLGRGRGLVGRRSRRLVRAPRSTATRRPTRRLRGGVRSGISRQPRAVCSARYVEFASRHLVLDDSVGPGHISRGERGGGSVWCG
jgi:hypothetical protein